MINKFKSKTESIDCPNCGEVAFVTKQTHEYELRKQKYKRCLAMAKWCDAERDIFNLTPKVTKVEFFARWHKRWSMLAEKFKPNSTAQ